MDSSHLSGAIIRQDFIDFFIARGHAFVPSSSLVPGGDQTLLFTNAGMVQFKDIFLGTEKRSYTRAVNSQKCMRVAGKHNDLEDVGRDDTHHTFFEMLGNWSFGDYYKYEAIRWAWELLTEVWKLPKDKLWATCFRDDVGDIPQDEEAASIWRDQPGMFPDHVVYFGRKDNFWEMAETGPCGPCSEIHLDRGKEYCDKSDVPGHICSVNTDCKRFLELWNLVFIQYNRIYANQFEPLPSKHVDTGMGLERIVSVLQNVNSNYKTDLLFPIIQKVQSLTGQSDQERDAQLTPYRVIADHTRACTFLIADGVVPGNTGRNYVCRMIIRRAARFGSKLGLNEPFLAKTAETVIDYYGTFYPELMRNKNGILTAITREEEHFHRTLESGLLKLEASLTKIQQQGEIILSGEQAFDLYATYGLPYEITRDITQEQNLAVDEAGFQKAMEEHRLASGSGELFGELGGEDAEFYRQIFDELRKHHKLQVNGVEYDPYSAYELEGDLLAMVSNGIAMDTASEGDQVAVVLPKTCFYIEAGGQVSDTGTITSLDGSTWAIKVTGMRKPAAGMIVHVGEVIKGNPKTGDRCIARIDAIKRQDTMRNHTATHLLHHQLRAVLGEHARQAGSLVAPEKLRFDFTHPEPLSDQELERIQNGVNQEILGNYKLHTQTKLLQQAIDEGAMALFGEKYGDIVRNITIGDQTVFSNELCGGTHVEETGDIGLFLITSESSAAAGVRRIEAVTGRAAYELTQRQLQVLHESALILNTSPDLVLNKIKSLLNELSLTHKQFATLNQKTTLIEFEKKIQDTQTIDSIHYLSIQLTGVNIDNMRQMVDMFRKKYPEKGIVVLASIQNNRPQVLIGITNDLVKKGLNAIELVKYMAVILGGNGGGKPNLAQAGGNDTQNLTAALDKTKTFIIKKSIELKIS
jgi:alanyl-tRNA synthetase